jgi:soluble lytic murein transglycosylase-like protein
MPEIKIYDDNVAAQGQLNVRATGADFGAQVGDALQGLGAAVGQFGDVLHQQEVADDVTNVHVAMAKERAAWQQELTNRTNNAQPGDDTFAPKLMDDMRQRFDKLGAEFKTRRGQDTFARMSADMTAMYGQEAVGVQGRLAGEAAKNQFNTLSSTLGSVAIQDHTQWESLIKQATAAIDDPAGRFGRVPSTAREAFKQSIAEQIKFDAAKGFARRYPNAVLGTVPQQLRESVKAVVAEQPRPGLPPDLKAPIVKPYDQPRLDSLVKTVNMPSQYDQHFKDAAALYNLDWRDLKLRAVAESGLNPTAQSSQGAQGIMQMVPAMAKQLGVDANNPKDAIFGAAKLVAQYRTKADGDMAKVDMMYYGGEGGTAWGPNTRQYAANLAAARQVAGLGSQVPPEAFKAPAAEQTGQSQEWKKPSTGIGFIDSLPADKFFAIVTEAEQYQRAYDSESERSRIAAERAKKQAQDGVMNTFLARIVDPKGAGGALSEREILADNTLDWQQKQHAIDYMMRREREMSAQAEPRTNPGKVRELMLQIHAADGDPTKTYNMDPVMQAYRDGDISTPEMLGLRREVEQLRDGSTGGFQKDVQRAREVVYTALTRSIIGQVQPEVAADAAYRFNADMEQQIERLRKENKDPRVLLDPMSRDYLLKPERIQAFMGNSRQSVAKQAADAATQQLQPGAEMPGKDGKLYRFKGGDPKSQGNWEPVTGSRVATGKVQ